MKNDVYYLPQYFTGDEQKPVHIQYYEVDKPSVKNRIVFSQNLICFMQQGVKCVYSSHEPVQITNDEFFLLNTRSVLMSESLSTGKQYKTILIFFSNAFLADFFLRHPMDTIKQTSTTPDLLVLRKDAFIRNFETSLQLLTTSTPAMAQVKLEELLLYLLTHHGAHTRAFLAKAQESDTETRIRQVVHANLDKGLNVDEMAFLCNMSVSSFKRHFTTLFHTSPGKYITTARMTRARQWLAANKRASDIYADLGYESLPAFSSEFKKHTGVSPREFQQQLNRKAQVFEPLA